MDPGNGVIFVDRGGCGVFEVRSYDQGGHIIPNKESKPYRPH